MHNIDKVWGSNPGHHQKYISVYVFNGYILYKENQTNLKHK